VERRQGSQRELEQLAGILDSMPVGVCYLDTDLRYTYINDHFVELTGIRRETHLGMTVREVMPEVADQIETQLRHVIRTRLPLTRGMLSAPTPAHPNERRYYQHNFSALIGEDGAVKGVNCIVYDATDRHRTEQALQESEDAFRAIYDSAPDMFISVCPETGSVLKCNRTLLQALGYTREEVVGQPVFGLYDPACLDDVNKVFRAFVNGEETNFAELRLKRKNGTPLDVSLSVSIVRDADGNIRYSSSTFRDVTVQRRLEAQLRQAQKLESIGQLAAGIAHEINTPAQFVLDNTTFLKEAFVDVLKLEAICRRALDSAAADELSPARVDELVAALAAADFAFLRSEIPACLDQTLNGISRIATIVRAMKTFSHPGQDQKMPADVNQAIANCVTLSANEWKYVATVQTNLDETMPLIHCFRNELEQVIVNLIVNAAHAIDDRLGAKSGGRDPDEKGLIAISTRQLDSAIEIRVRDTGTGIPAHVRDRIFDPFFTTKEVGKGTGQGLSLAHSVVVRKHGGRLDVETQTGVGTTFVIRLPIEAQPKTAAA
jgi:PAS domain S-box-containing protein